MFNRKLQLSFLQKQGLLPHHILLDFGCGPCYAGEHFVSYLDSGNYYGCDHKSEIIRIAEKRLTDLNLMGKMPNLSVVQDFELPYVGLKFDFIWLYSVFTHLSLLRARECVIKLLKCLKNNGLFLVTINLNHIYEARNDQPQSRYEILDVRYPFDHFQEIICDIANVKLFPSEDTAHFFTERVVEIKK